MRKLVLKLCVLTLAILAITVFALSCGGDGNVEVTTTVKVPEVTVSPDVTTKDDADSTTVPTDTEAPVLRVDALPESVLTSSVTISGSVSDNEGVSSLTVGASTVGLTGDTFSVNYELSAGENVIEIFATDAAGNVSEKKTVKVTYIAYLNNIMEKDGVLTVYNSPACAAAHQDGFVFIYNGEIYLIDGGMTDTSASSTYSYLLKLRDSVIAGTDIATASDMKLQLNLIISHFHYDHVQALAEQIIPDGKFEIANIYYTKPSVYALGGDSDERAGVLDAANTAKSVRHELDFGKTEEFSVGELSFKLYAPSEDWGKDSASKIRSIYYPSKGADYACSDAVENSNSMWTRVSFGGKTMLFTGDVTKKMHESYEKIDGYDDIGGEPFDAMISYYGKSEFDIDIVKFPHHGSDRTAAMHAVQEVMTPDVIIFTSLYNEYRPVMYTLGGAMYERSYASSGLDGMTFTLTASGKLDAKRGDKTESIYGENGEYLGIHGELFETRDAGVTPSASLSGKGTESEPYLIGTREDLAYFAKNYYTLCGENGAVFKLTADIVWSDYKTGLLPVSNWTPIGSPAIGMKPFTGTFDGDGHSISGIYCAGSKEGTMIFGGDNYYLLGNVSALFGALNGTVKNLVIKDSSFLGNRMVGAFVAHIAPDGNTNIVNCANFALVQAYEGVGGIFGGYFQRSDYGILHDDVTCTGSVTIDKCVNFGKVNSPSTNANSSVGGIAGSLREMKRASVTECANYADVASSGGCVGGIVGQAVYCEMTMKNCVNAGAVLGSTLTGGVIGKIQHDTQNKKTLEGLLNYAHVGTTSDGRVGYLNGSSTGAQYQDCFKGTGAYYLNGVMLVVPNGKTVVTAGTAYEAYYTGLDGAALASLVGNALSADVWSAAGTVEGAGYGLPAIKTVTVVKLCD